MSTIIGYLCSPRVYEYKGLTFEVPAYSPPWPLKKNGDPRKRMGLITWRIIEEWGKLPPKKQEKYRVGGGCMEVRR